MSIPEHSFNSTITASSDNTSTIFNTKTGTNTKNKINNRFDSDSDSENSKSNNMRRTRTSKKNTIQYYTINGTTDSDSITSKSKTTKDLKNNDMSYHPSTNDDTTSYFLNKDNAARRNQRNSTKYIQPNFIKYNQNNNNTSIISPSSKIQNHKLRQKNKIIPKKLYLHQHQTISPTKHIQSSKITTNPIHLKKNQIRNI